MPTQTFFRLPEEKRERLTEAAWEEFMSVPFADASSPFASADAALDITTPGLIASPTGASTTETPNPTPPAPSTGQTQRQTWIRGKK